jgi:glycosyltransferase involved in cell wall biosynthesis
MISECVERSTGMNVVAHLKAEMGVGEVARRLISLLSASGLDLNLVPFEASKARKDHEGDYKLGDFVASQGTLSCVNADQLGAAIAYFGITSTAKQFHNGFWAWELEDFPTTYSPAARLLDQIWTLSSFAQASIKKAVNIPVRMVKVPVPIPNRQTALCRRDFGIPEKTLLVTSSFDFDSDIERKNPAASIDAFLKAFPKPVGATLFLKSINGSKHQTKFNELKELSKGRNDIVFSNAYLNHYENKGLLELTDLYLSLHRSEGYGLNLADSMARKTAVMATGYSGNMDFMDDESNALIPFEKIPVTQYAGISVDSNWADPDVDFAAYKLRELLDSPALVKELAINGFTKIKNENSLAVVVKKFQKEFMNA